jgi:hypothetical protein
MVFRPRPTRRSGTGSSRLFRYRADGHAQISAWILTFAGVSQYFSQEFRNRRVRVGERFFRHGELPVVILARSNNDR